MAQLRTRSLLVVVVVGYMLLAFQFISRDTNCPILSDPDYSESRADSDDVNRNDNVGPIAAPQQAVQVPDGRQAITAPPHKQYDLPVLEAAPAQSKKHMYPVNSLPHTELLNSKYAPNSVFWVWCGRRWFEFNHYLSVVSVLKELQPDNAIFFYDNLPITDYWLYNTWFSEIKEKYPFFRPQALQPSDFGCTDFIKPNRTFIASMLTRMGGFYFSEHTIISDFSPQLRNYSMVDGYDPLKLSGFYMSTGGLPGHLSIEQAVRDIRFSTKSVECIDMTYYIKAESKPPCVNVHSQIFPKDIWELKNDFGRLARRVFYDTEEILKPKQNFDELIPNIAHIAWIGGGPMDYLFYLCVLSLLYVAEVDTLYIHGNGPPTGPYWNLVKNHPRLKTIYREVPGDVYGTRVNVLSHVTDVWRVDFMIKYGGIYVDTDTIWVRPLDRNIRAYDAVGSYDWTYWNPPFPDTINFGVAIGKRNAPYWHDFQESMKWFIDSDWSWNGLRQPYRIKERKPDSVLIDPHLQVICFNYLCHPTWWPDYHNESVHHMNSPSLPDWRQDAYAFHMTLPTPPELIDEEALMRSDSIFAQMGRYVLARAGRLPKRRAPLQKKT